MITTHLTGRLGSDPEMRYTTDGIPVCNMSVAVRLRNGETLWVKVVAWRKLAEICNEYLRKGRQIFVTGTPKAEGFEKKEGGIGTKLTITASSIEFLGKGNGNGEENNDEAPEYPDREAFEEEDEEEIPF